MRTIDKIGGASVALVTPFKKDMSVDYDTLISLVNRIVVSGIKYITVFGTTSEVATLTSEEKSQVLSVIKSTIAGRCGLVLGIGGNNTAEAGRAIEQLDDIKDIDALLVVSPYYNCPTQEGLYQHYKYIAERSELGIIAYNVPSRTGRNMEADTTLRLANDGLIVGVKEASGIMSQVTNIIYNKPEGFVVLSGDDILTLPIIATGGDGAISVIANAFPFEYSEMVKMALKGDFEKARFYHKLLHKMYKLLFLEGNPAGVKALLSNLSLSENILRLPLTPVSELTYNEIAIVCKKISENSKKLL